MAKDRIYLHELLKSVSGIENVYFQPPESLKMRYPAIVYSRSRIQNKYADNVAYNQDNVYEVIVIDSYPDSEAVKKLSLLPFCRYDRNYKANNLNHDVFTIYYSWF